MQKNSVYNIRDFGAVGDGKTKDTAALQKAIDACHGAGGGQVLFPAGSYLSGTLFLKNNVELHLSSGAVLLGSPDATDYNAEDVFPENRAFAAENVTARHLIIAYRQENISITGNGAIDGNSSAFFEPLPAGESATYRHKTANYPIAEWRPGQMVFFCRSKNITVHDVRLLNSPYWTLFCLGCEDVQVQGVLIENPPATANGDGIDIDCCRNVTISDCIVRSGDDSITVRANSAHLPEGEWSCENVVVSNCILKTPCNAIRVGVGNGEIRNCLFSNIIIAEASRGISIVSLYTKTEASPNGVCIENIHFSDFIIEADVPITVGTGEATRPGAIRDISFNRFRITSWAASQIVGNMRVPVERVRFRDCEWMLHGGTENTAFQKEMPKVLQHFGYRGRNGDPALPCALYGTHIEGLSLENSRFRWEKTSRNWLYGIFLERVRDFELMQSTLRQPEHEEGAAVFCRECADVRVVGCRAPQETHCVLRAEASAENTVIRSSGNDWRSIEQPIKSDISVEVF